MALFTFLFGGSLAAGAAAEGLQPRKPSAITKPCVIISSDFPPLDVIPGRTGYGPDEKRGDPDDVQSMVRFLLYANEFDVEGRVHSTGRSASAAKEDFYRLIQEAINPYDKGLSNLLKRFAQVGHLTDQAMQEIRSTSQVMIGFDHTGRNA